MGYMMAVRLEPNKELDEAFEEDKAFETYLDAVKDDVAYCLGIEEDSEEWWELMNI